MRITITCERTSKYEVDVEITDEKDIEILRKYDLGEIKEGDIGLQSVLNHYVSDMDAFDDNGFEDVWIQMPDEDEEED